MNLFKALVFAMVMGSISLIQAEPLGTAFTYQGELRQLGQPAHGIYDFEIGLYSAASGGLPLDLLTLDDVTVDGGIFSVQLDFTAVPFDGEQAWLAIAVRPGASSGGYTGLLPRQKLTAVPYALNALSVTAGAIDSVAIADGQVGRAKLAANAVGTSEIISNEVQRRVFGTCATGSFLSGIAEDGGVICSIVPLGLVHTLDRDGGYYVGLYSSTAIRDSGFPVVSYFDSSNGLKLFDCSNLACSAGTARILDSTGFAGEYTSIAIRDSGFPVVSYRASGGLKLYDCYNAACSAGIARTLDSTGGTGEYTSIAIRDSDFPVVSYFDSTNADLKLYDCSNAACSGGSVRTLDSNGYVGEYTSIAIRGSGLPMVSYYDLTNDSLKVYDCSNAACSAGTDRTLDSGGDVGMYTSIAIRDSGLPVVSYRESTDGALKLFDCSNAACSSGTARTLDSTARIWDSIGQVGSYTSIAIRDSGLPVVSYFDGSDTSNGSLKLYSCGDDRCEK